jgi:hypothetical protein
MNVIVLRAMNVVVLRDSAFLSIVFQQRLLLTLRIREEHHNPALKYASNGKKVSQRTLASSVDAHDRHYPPPDVALCRIFRAQEESSFAQVGCPGPSALSLLNPCCCMCKEAL